MPKAAVRNGAPNQPAREHGVNRPARSACCLRLSLHQQNAEHPAGFSAHGLGPGVLREMGDRKGVNSSARAFRVKQVQIKSWIGVGALRAEWGLTQAQDGRKTPRATIEQLMRNSRVLDSRLVHGHLAVCVSRRRPAYIDARK